MCLGIAGKIVSIDAAQPDLARVDVQGTTREVNLVMLAGTVVPGDWVLIHLGFAVERLTPEQAATSIADRERLHSGVDGVAT
jgi:hydrogenase expression/formation protein HypC